MTSRSYFGKMNSTLGSIVPVAMFPVSTVSTVIFPKRETAIMLSTGKVTRFKGTASFEKKQKNIEQL